MKLHVRVGAHADTAAWCGLAWEHDGMCYPHAEHHDFGPEVLGQWAIAARELLRGAQGAVLRFLEGGHGLAVSRIAPDRDDCLLYPIDVEPPVHWTTTVRELATVVHAAATNLATHLPHASDLAHDASLLGELLHEA